VAFQPRQAAIIAAAIVIVAVGGGLYYHFNRSVAVLDQASAAGIVTGASSANGDASGATTGDVSTSDLMVAGPLGEMTLGDPKAPNVMIEYVSMTCPHCQRFQTEVFPEVKKQFIDTGKVYYLLREYPLDPLARAAIVVARCAPPERFFPLVDLMYEHQDQWAFVDKPVDALFNLVKQAGFTREAFDACLTNQKLLDGVNWVQDRAINKFGVNSTPTFFINGKKVLGEQTLDDIKGALKL
jgi:protein-disulfide isomerase